MIPTNEPEAPKLHIHLTLSHDEALWLHQLLEATEAETEWGKTFHRISRQLARNLTNHSTAIIRDSVSKSDVENQC